MWTREQRTRWTRWEDIVAGVDFATDPRREVDTVVLEEGVDGADIPVLVHLLRRLQPSPVRLIVTTSHPSALRAEAARDAGADQVLLTGGHAGNGTEPPLRGAVELGSRLCPALHESLWQRQTLSVCGEHGDRLVLAPHHLDRWCLAGKEGCPHWRGGSHA